MDLKHLFLEFGNNSKTLAKNNGYTVLNEKDFNQSVAVIPQSIQHRFRF